MYIYIKKASDFDCGYYETFQKLQIKDLCMQSIQIFSAPVEPAGFCSSQPSVQGRGNLFNELPTPQQLHDQEKYKDCLKQQVRTFSQLWILLSVLSSCCLTLSSSLG